MAVDRTKRTDLAGQSVKQGGYTVTYDDRGYVKRTSKDGGASATSTVKTQNANKSAAHQEAYQAAQKGDWDAVGAAINKISGADKSANVDMTEANAYLRELTDEFKYNAKDYIDKKAEAAGLGGNANSGTVSGNPAAGATNSGVAGVSGSVSGGSGAAAPVSPATGLRDYLDQWLASAKAQAELKTDYAVQQGVNELTRAEEDAKEQFQTQRDQIEIDEAKAKDNQALYAGAQGDKGGIGAAQYDSIMNTAAQNRLAVNSAQTKLATDTARQISDLRAHGEFEKADALLQLGQTYLSQLMSLEQWALQYGLNVAQFNASLDQWAKEYEMQLGNMLGVYQGLPTLEAQKLQNNQLASAGEALLAAGIMPSESQLAAMGLTADQAQSYLTAAQLAAASRGSTSSSGGGGGGSPTGTTTPSGSGINALFLAAYESGQPAQSFLKQSSNLKQYGLNSQPSFEDYEAWVENLPEAFTSKQVQKNGKWVTENGFETWLRKVQTMLSEENPNAGTATGEYTISAELDKYWPVLTTAQRTSLQKLCAQYGLEYVYE